MRAHHGWGAKTERSTNHAAEKQDNLETALTRLLDDRVEFYRKYVSNPVILAMYVEDTRRHLIEHIDRVFSAQIKALTGDTVERK